MPDAEMDLRLQRLLFLSDRSPDQGELTRDQTMQQIEQGWEKITDEEERDKQKEAYASSLNIQR